MNFKTIIVQNILLVLGIIFIYKFFHLQNLYQQMKAWKEGFPVIDGDGIGLTFLGLPLNDDGVHWTEIMSVATPFLFLGISLVLISIGMLVWKAIQAKA